jgi:hypothetical protein
MSSARRLRIASTHDGVRHQRRVRSHILARKSHTKPATFQRSRSRHARPFRRPASQPRCPASNLPALGDPPAAIRRPVSVGEFDMPMSDAGRVGRAASAAVSIASPKTGGTHGLDVLVSGTAEVGPGQSALVFAGRKGRAFLAASRGRDVPGSPKPARSARHTRRTA